MIAVISLLKRLSCINMVDIIIIININVAEITWPKIVCVTTTVASNINVAEITWPKICA